MVASLSALLSMSGSQVPQAFGSKCCRFRERGKLAGSCGGVQERGPITDLWINVTIYIYISIYLYIYIFFFFCISLSLSLIPMPVSLLRARKHQAPRIILYFAPGRAATTGLGPRLAGTMGRGATAFWEPPKAERKLQLSDFDNCV